MNEKLFCVLLLIFIFTGCKDDPEENNITTDNFDRRAMLSNTGNSVILPAYADLVISVDSLEIYASAFNTNPDLVSLGSVQQSWLTAAKNWMHCSAFEFGPASTVLLRQTVNTFPCDTVQVNSNISSGTYDLSAVSNLDAIGFPALDFLLFRGTDALVVAEFSTTPNALNRKNYLLDVISDMKSKINQVNTNWLASGGNYISTFENSTGTDVGSSIGFLVNQLNFDYEILKNARIGIPLGKQTLNIPLPEKCEAVYSGYSLELAVEHVRAVENIFCGKTKAGVDGSGLDDYLDYLGATTSGNNLTLTIKNKFVEIITALQNVTGPLSDAVVTNPAQVEIVYTKILEGLILLKTDMPSALGVLITYQDNDGD